MYKTYNGAPYMQLAGPQKFILPFLNVSLLSCDFFNSVIQKYKEYKFNASIIYLLMCFTRNSLCFHGQNKLIYIVYTLRAYKHHVFIYTCTYKWSQLDGVKRLKVYNIQYKMDRDIEVNCLLITTYYNNNSLSLDTGHLPIYIIHYITMQLFYNIMNK